MNPEKRVEIGTLDTVIVDKLFGPLIMCDLKITVDGARGEWIIERQVSPKNGTTSWETVARIDGQNSITFEDE